MPEPSNILSAVSWLCSALCVIVLLYVVTAPPIMVSLIRRYGLTPEILWFFGPVFRIMQSDFGGPMVRYFKSVGGLDVLLMGGAEEPPWYVVPVYTSLGLAAFALIALPFCRAWRFRRS